MTQLTYAGIGSRQTPREILQIMTRMAAWLAGEGWHLHSGGAEGADTAFASGVPVEGRTQYLPWRNFRRLSGPDCVVLTSGEMGRCMANAEEMHPAWERCKPTVRKLHARNVAILLGADTHAPVHAVVCWTPGAQVVGGTGMGIRIAQRCDIPVFNLADRHPRDICHDLRSIRDRVLSGT